MKLYHLIAYMAVGSYFAFAEETCWKQVASRGVGQIPSICPSGMQLENGLCYTKCSDGYRAGVTTCHQYCPSDFSDLISSCVKPSYTRSPCWKSRSCNRKIGLFYYPRCKSGYSEWGTMCFKSCPDGMTDIGASCEPDSYSRGVGIVPTECPDGQENDAGLCYPTCSWEGSDGDQVYAEGVGPLCWG